MRALAVAIVPVVAIVLALAVYPFLAALYAVMVELPLDLAGWAP